MALLLRCNPMKSRGLGWVTKDQMRRGWFDCQTADCFAFFERVTVTTWGELGHLTMAKRGLPQHQLASKA